MANQEMWDNLSSTAITANYTTAIAWSDFPPQNILSFVPVVPKKKFAMGDGSFSTITKGDLYYIVTVQWDIITASNHGILFNLYSDPNKANEQDRSFYWDHPVDGHSYTTYFHSELTSNYVAKMPNFLKIDPVKLRVIGRKPS